MYLASLYFYVRPHITSPSYEKAFKEAVLQFIFKITQFIAFLFFTLASTLTKSTLNSAS